MNFSKRIFTNSLVAISFFAITLSINAVTIQSDSQAPNFTLTGHDGESHKLSDYKGKWVVLEWYNEGCPYVRKHYDAPPRNMQNLQKKYTTKDVVWLSIISSAPGKQGYVKPKDGSNHIKKHQSKSSVLLFDPEGTVGKQYDAKTTPHMYIIDPKGKLVYQGAIDNKPSAKLSSLNGATPIFANALNSAMTGKKIANNTTKPYGCSVKYK